MKTLERSAPATRHLFIYICAANEKKRLLNIQHLVWIRLDPLGRNRGRFVLHISPRFLTEGEKAVGSYLQMTLMLQTFCWVGTSDLVIMNSWAWWNHPESFSPCGHIVIMHHCVISRFIKWDYCSLPVYRLTSSAWFRQRHDVFVHSRCLVDGSNLIHLPTLSGWKDNPLPLWSWKEYLC